MNIFSYISSGIDWLFFKKDVRLWQKLAAGATFIICLYTVNGVLGISTFSFTSKKIETMKNINELLKDKELDSTIRAKLKKELIDVSNQMSIQEQLLSFFDSKPNKYAKEINNPVTANAKIINQEYSLFWLIVSSIGVFVIGGIGETIRSNKPTLLINFGKGVRGVILTLAANISFWIVLYLVVNSVPAISITTDTIKNRYLSNGIYQGSFIIALVLLVVFIVGKTVRK